MPDKAAPRADSPPNESPGGGPDRRTAVAVARPAGFP